MQTLSVSVFQLRFTFFLSLIVYYVLGYGDSNALPFEYALGVDPITQIESGYGGGKEITIAGHGFSDDTTTVEVCGNVCQRVGNVTYNSMKCIAPVNNG